MKIIPIYTSETKQYFCEYNQPIPVHRGLATFRTHLLRPGIMIPLFTLGQTESLLETGLLDRTDYIETVSPRPRVAGLLLRVIKEDRPDVLFHMELEDNDHTNSQFQRDFDQIGEFAWKAQLMFGVYDPEGESSAVITDVKAHLNTIKGTVSLEARCICQDTDFADGIEVVGYELDIHRFNSDRKSTKRSVSTPIND